MNQARRTWHFARSARQGEAEKIKRRFICFLSFPRHAFRAKWHVRLAWLIKRLFAGYHSVIGNHALRAQPID